MPTAAQRRAWIESLNRRTQQDLAARQHFEDVARFSDISQDLKADLEHARAFRAITDEHLNKARPGMGKTTYKARREVEHRLADYLEQNEILPEEMRRLRGCRLAGNYGYRANAPEKTIVRWDDKCGLTRLCPDEAREEQRRLVRAYLEPMMRWKEKSYWRRVQKLVITWPNIAIGDLAKFKRLQFKEFNKLIKKWPMVRGSLVSQEDPLSTRGDWNLHLNALLLVDGRFDWSEFRAAWHKQTWSHFPGCGAADFQIDFKQLPRDRKSLEQALGECIKYPVKHVTEKANHDNGKRDGAAGGDRGSDQACEGREPGAGAAGGAKVSGISAALGRYGYGHNGYAIDEQRKSLLVIQGGGRAAAGNYVNDGTRAGCGESGSGHVVDDAGAAPLGSDGIYNAVGYGRIDQETRSNGSGGKGTGAGQDAENDCAGARELHGEYTALAPAMIEWPAERFLEWWEAGLRFRRTRSYGCLLSIAALYWRMMPRDQRERLLESIVSDKALAGTVWRKLPKATRAELEDLVLPAEEPIGDVVWVGRVAWCVRARAYKVFRPSVDLIPDDKSLSRATQTRAPPELLHEHAARRRAAASPGQMQLYNS